MNKKVVINTCFGGFGLSYKGVMKYAELKGIKIYAFVDRRDINRNLDLGSGLMDEYSASDGKKPFIIHYSTSPLVEGRYEEGTYWVGRDIERDDKFLVQVVEDMGDVANGSCAELEVREIPSDIEYHIDEYDGAESIHENHRSW